MQEMISKFLYYSAFLFQLVGYIMLYTGCLCGWVLLNHQKAWDLQTCKAFEYLVCPLKLFWNHNSLRCGFSVCFIIIYKVPVLTSANLGNSQKQASSWVKHGGKKKGIKSDHILIIIFLKIIYSKGWSHGVFILILI